MSHAHIVLIYELSKDSNVCASYRSIALLNNDFKYLTKRLTLRLQKLLPSVIYPEQSRFMAHKSTDINLCRFFTNIHTPYSNYGSRVVASLDMEKAFNTVEWPFLWETLHRIGFPLCFTGWLKILYKGPIASVRLVGGLSSPFNLHRGTRRGCPLSPTLFAIVIEPVVEALRTSPHIKALRIGWLEERVAIYAADLLLFLNDAGPSLQGALQVLNSYSTFTGLRVNWTKSLLFPIDPGDRPLLLQICPYKCI